MVYTSKTNKRYSEVFLTDVVTIGWPALAEPKTPRDVPNATPKYRVVGFIDKTEEKGLQSMFEFITTTASNANKLSDLTMHPFRGETRLLNDGDLPEFIGKAGHSGRYFFSASTTNRPAMFVLGEDGNMVDITTNIDAIKHEFYSGCKCKLALKAMEYKPNKVSFILLAIQKVADGERFGGLGQIDLQNMFLAASQGWTITKIDEDGGCVVEDADETGVTTPVTPVAAPQPVIQPQLAVQQAQQVAQPAAQQVAQPVVKKKSNLSSLL